MRIILHGATGQKTGQSQIRQMICANCPIAPLQLLNVRALQFYLQGRRSGTLWRQSGLEEMGNKKQTSYHVFKKLDLFEKTGIMKSQFFYLLTQEFEVSSQTNFSSFLLPEHRSPLGSWSSPSLSLSFLICTMGRMTIPPTVTHTYTQSGRIQWAKAWKCSPSLLAGRRYGRTTCWLVSWTTITAITITIITIILSLLLSPKKDCI